MPPPPEKIETPKRATITIREISNGILVSRDSDHTYFPTYGSAIDSLMSGATQAKRKTK